MRQGLDEADASYPFLLYGTDWLAFAHLAIAVAFYGQTAGGTLTELAPPRVHFRCAIRPEGEGHPAEAWPHDANSGRDPRLSRGRWPAGGGGVAPECAGRPGESGNRGARHAARSRP
ncbi:hypothetical protein ACIREM_29130 [Streptomyces shenzhenensis]|uniref:hypothetical protein n=1 Tax=Streptomyces shenzhenensis TaxID=943815 RepID=UPI00381582E5